MLISRIADYFQKIVLRLKKSNLLINKGKAVAPVNKSGVTAFSLITFGIIYFLPQADTDIVLYCVSVSFQILPDIT